MVFQFPVHGASAHIPADRDPSGAPLRPSPHVVARTIAVAPCGLIFFDGSESMMEEDGLRLILPGGAFFPSEARTYPSAAQAEAEACRLNGASPCQEPPWRAIPLAGLGGAEGTGAPAPRQRMRALRWRR